jgi:predicted nucleic acid-binding protein
VAILIVFDASVIIAYLDPSDRFHAEAVDLVLSTVGNRRGIHSLNMAEVLAGAQNDESTNLLWEAVTEKMRVEISNAPGPLLLAKVRRRTGLKMPDAVVLATALAEDGLVASFDDRLKSAARNAGVLYVQERDSAAP